MELGYRVCFADSEGVYRCGIVTSTDPLRAIVNDKDVYFEARNIQFGYPPCVENCPKCKVNIMHTLSDIWQEDWKRFESGKVTSVIQDQRSNAISYTYYRMDERDRVPVAYHPDDIRDVPEKYRENVEIQCNHFYGFANVQDRTIHFDKTGYNELDFDRQITGTFGKDYQYKSDSYLPKERDTIIGLIGFRDDNRRYFKKWFIASPEFYRVWSYIIGSGRTPKTVRTMPWESLIKFSGTVEHGLSLITHRYQRSYWAWIEIYPTLVLMYHGQFDKIRTGSLPKSFVRKLACKIFQRCEQRVTRVQQPSKISRVYLDTFSQLMTEYKKTADELLEFSPAAEEQLTDILIGALQV